MNKHWDYDVPSVELWRECLRVLKPGGHLLSFAGTRTYHRMTVRIEDAGFEIRDMISYIYGSGFPKSLNIKKALEKEYGDYQRVCSESQTEHGMRPMPETDLSQAVSDTKTSGEILLESLQEQGSQISGNATDNVRGQKSCLEGRSNLQEVEGELYRCEICEMPTRIFRDGKERRVYYGTQVSNGKTPEQIINENGSSSPHRPQSSKQQNRKFNVICEQCLTQAIRRFDGFGTALKPSNEPICVARKPLIGTVANNVLEYGTGGINIDGCRIGITDEKSKNNWKPKGYELKNSVYEYGSKEITTEQNPAGRFPANIIFDEIAGVMLDEQSGELKSGANKKGSIVNSNEKDKSKFLGRFGALTLNKDYEANTGGASRFFYCAKASKAERNGGLEGFEEKGIDIQQPHNSKDLQERYEMKSRNFHPTVKPLKLMQYLVRLVTPPNGICLDPFCGSGTTLMACVKEGFNYIGIEREADYVKIAEARIEWVKKQEIPKQVDLFTNGKTL